MAAFLANMEKHSFYRHGGDVKIYMNLHQNWCHLRLERILHNLVRVREVKALM
jgi:hypothetical protein